MEKTTFDISLRILNVNFQSQLDEIQNLIASYDGVTGIENDGHGPITKLKIGVEYAEPQAAVALHDAIMNALTKRREVAILSIGYDASKLLLRK